MIIINILVLGFFIHKITSFLFETFLMDTKSKIVGYLGIPAMCRECITFWVGIIVAGISWYPLYAIFLVYIINLVEDYIEKL